MELVNASPKTKIKKTLRVYKVNKMNIFNRSHDYPPIHQHASSQKLLNRCQSWYPGLPLKTVKKIKFLTL
jgi:hypothetical protein